MNLTIFSIFRDREWVFPRYFDQIERLMWPYGEVYVVAVENDSKDSTRQKLEEWAYDNKHILGESTGEPYYLHVERSQTLRILTEAANIGYDYIADLDTEYVMFIENDVTYYYDLAEKLKSSVDATNGIVAPMVYMNDIFYDFWAFRYISGKHFEAQTRDWFHHNHSGILQIQAAGTCLMFKREILVKGVRPTIDECLVGFCKEAAKLGYPTYVDFDTEIVHHYKPGYGVPT